MHVIRSIDALRERVRTVRSRGRLIGLVPTMGALHEGHLSLVRAAAAESDEVVVSIFVNPAQFNDPDDLENYPRDERRDRDLAAEAGASILFVPDEQEVYPPGSDTRVHIGGVSRPLEGVARGPGHFDGVALVVCKLFGMVQPDAAWFGQKDAQQVAVVRQLVRDLNIGVDIRTGPTIREPDGLAMSSRNVRLPADSRDQALALHQGLLSVLDAVNSGESDPERVLAEARATMAERAVEPEYLAVVDPDTFEAVEKLGVTPALAVGAAWVRGVRLIDNEPVPATAGQ